MSCDCDCVMMCDEQVFFLCECIFSFYCLSFSHTLSFYSKLLGMGDVPALYNKLKDAVPKDQQNQEELMNKIQQGQFSLRDMYEQVCA